MDEADLVDFVLLNADAHQGGAIAIGVYAFTYLEGNEFYGGGAVNNQGVTILDHSTSKNGTRTVAFWNHACIISGDIGSNALLETYKPFCMGIERIDTGGSLGEQHPCDAFEVAASCIVEAREKSSTVAPTLDTPITPSLAPSSPAPTTPFPTTDPCQEDAESFRCMLHELLEALP